MAAGTLYTLLQVVRYIGRRRFSSDHFRRPPRGPDFSFGVGTDRQSGGIVTGDTANGRVSLIVPRHLR